MGERGTGDGEPGIDNGQRGGDLVTTVNKQTADGNRLLSVALATFSHSLFTSLVCLLHTASLFDSRVLVLLTSQQWQLPINHTLYMFSFNNNTRTFIQTACRLNDVVHHADSQQVIGTYLTFLHSPLPPLPPHAHNLYIHHLPPPPHTYTKDGCHYE